MTKASKNVDKLENLIYTDEFASPEDARNAAAAKAPSTFWDDDVPPGRLYRFTGRAFFGDAASEGGGKQSPGTEKSWVGSSANGNLTYFESRAQVAVFSQNGGVALSHASRSSDNARSGELNTIAGGFFALNDNTNAADKKSVWAMYGHAAQTQANKFTAAMELDACSTQTLVNADPYAMGSEGITANSWLGVGGETAQGLVTAGAGATLTNVSCAVGIINSASSAAGNRYAKGIVFQATSLTGTDGAGTGTGNAIELARGHEIGWKFSSGTNAFAAKIRADGGDAATHQRVVFSAGSMQVKGVKSDLTTETILFSVSAPAVGTNDTNYISMSPSQTGAGLTSIQAAGIDANIDIRLLPKGTGVLRLGYSTEAAAVPANFAANRYIAFKDSSGSTYYIPCMGAAW